MSGFLSFHRMAAARGDGLDPRLRELLEARQRLSGADAALVDISAGRGNHMVQAGPNPARTLPAFLPGNVVRFEPDAAAAATPQRSPATSAG